MMRTRKIYNKWLYIALVILLVGLLGNKLIPNKPPIIPTKLTEVVAPLTPSPSPSPFVKYVPPTLPIKDSYAVFLVGDSMTVALGPHPFRLSQRLNAAYPNAGFIIDNYGVGSVNIFSLPDLLTQEQDIDGKVEPAVLNRDFDILVIESFANNPMSDLPLEVGLQKQREVLDLTVGRLMREKPNAVIVLLATVAPSDRYGQGSIDIPPELRKNYAAERRAFLENFIRYAREKEFPFVNTYDITRLPSGDAKPGFISTDGYIHPSQMGVEFIQDQIADLIINQKIIPPN